MKEVELLQKKPTWYRRWWGITLILIFVLTLAFLALVIYQISNIYKQQQDGSYLSGEAPYNMDLYTDELSPSWGNDDAKINIVEFGDFNCTRCLQFFPVEQMIRAKYADQVKFYWRNYPVVKESSVEFALAGVCADRQDLFWPFHDRLFELQGTVSIGNLEEIAQGVGIEIKKFNECLEHSLTMSQLRKDFFAAQDAEINGTPTFLINGYKVQGALSPEAMEAIIQKFLLEYESDSTN